MSCAESAPHCGSLDPESSFRLKPACFLGSCFMKQDEPLVKIMPGGYYVGYGEVRIATTLGSCVAVCARDPVAGVGGMNHFMLPAGRSLVRDDWPAGPSSRYGVHAMEMLINAIIKRGGCRERLELKLFGGGHVLEHMHNDVGGQNIAFVRQFVATEGLTVLAEDLGGTVSRRVVYDVASGRVKVRQSTPAEARHAKQNDQNLIRQMSDRPAVGDVELFS